MASSLFAYQTAYYIDCARLSHHLLKKEKPDLHVNIRFNQRD